MRLSSRWSAGPPRKILTVAFAALCVIFIFAIRESRAPQTTYLGRESTLESVNKAVTTGLSQGVSRCPLDVKYLQKARYDLTKGIIFHRQCIRTNRSAEVDRSEVTDVPASIFGQWQALNLDDQCNQWQEMPCDPIELDVPPPFPVRRYPELLFGVATSFARLVDSVPQLSHWLSNTGARLVAVIVDADEHEADFGRLLAFFNDHGVDLSIARPQYTNLGVNEQHFTVIRDLLRHSTPETKWVGIIDDDTFFPSLYPLSEVLLNQDHTVPAYMGGLSDSMDAIQQHGLMAYGGAGAFLSMPLVRQLEQNIEKCLRQSNTQQGDALLKNCIYSETDSRLTLIPGLNQLDIIGDPSGFYESGRYPLSLHHWKTWHHAPVDHMAKAADFCGGCFLQRWRFGEDTVLANGYSVAVYSRGIDHDDLDRTEATFEYQQLFDWSYGPLRAKTDARKKKSFYLVDAEKIGKSLRQVYVHRGKLNSKDEVLELWWD